jgi:uncharacterized protein YecT (DUF1311 family)
MSLLLIANGTVGPNRARAQAPDKGEDQELNRVYQQLMSALPPVQKSQLRNAERAWLDFVARNTQALRAAGPAMGKPADECREFEGQQWKRRVSELRSMVQPDPDEKKHGAEDVARMDEELNVMYQRCLSSLKQPDVQRLREAQRTWIAFRDASRPLGPESVYQITAHRVTELHRFYIERAEDDTEKGSYFAGGTPDPHIPDPYERVRGK